MVSHQPNVSIVMPVRNAECFLEEALASVSSQTYQGWELIVVDDGSTDRTPEILDVHASREPRTRILRNSSSLGVAPSLNRAISVAKHPLIARLDGDDRCGIGRLEHQVRAFESDPHLVLCGTSARLIDDHGARLGIRRPPSSDWGLKRRLLRDNCFVHSSVMFRKDSWQRAGRYPTGVIFEDYWLWIAMAPLGTFTVIDELLVDHRIHPSSKTRSVRKRAQRAERLRAQLHAGRTIGPAGRATFEIARSGLAWISSSVRRSSDVGV